MDGVKVERNLAEIEIALVWLEQNLRKPRINGLEGWGVPTEPSSTMKTS